MNEQIRAIASRIKELREILDITAEQMSIRVGLPHDEYECYESASKDIPIGVLYAVAGVLGVDPTVLLSGDDPHMNTYTVVRRGKGMRVERFKGYSFDSLAFNYIGRDMEPMIVTITPADKPVELVTHAGQEFNLVLKGSVALLFGGHEIVLAEGDSVYFNPEIPHGQRAVGGQAQFLTVINDMKIK